MPTGQSSTHYPQAPDEVVLLFAKFQLEPRTISGAWITIGVQRMSKAEKIDIFGHKPAIFLLSSTAIALLDRHRAHPLNAPAQQ